MNKDEMIARMQERADAPSVPEVNNIDDALEERRTEHPEESQTEKSRRAVMDEIRELLSTHPELSNKDIALRVGATPKQVGAQRYLMSDKGKAQASASYERVKAARTPQNAPKAETPGGNPQEAETPATGQASNAQSAFKCSASEMAAETLERALKVVQGRVTSMSVSVMTGWLNIEVVFEGEATPES